ncbi:MAG: hypothetical protein LBD91_00010 [Prevotellaceae bacterium]|jgi:hypothetical protein|nr:hypothetical protein [Prevotellaceae bacterium]
MESTTFYTLLAAPTSPDDDTLTELQELAARYPWFSLSHQLLYETMVRRHDPDAKRYATTAGVYAADRRHFYWRLQQPVTDDDIIDWLDDAPIASGTEDQPEQIEMQPASDTVEELINLHIEEPADTKATPKGTSAPAKPPFAGTGGEYFDAVDFSEVDLTDDDPLSQFIKEQPKINPNTSPLYSIEWEDAAEKRRTPIDYVTETLAQIYVEQQLYDLAADTYEKLILQIPEKSAYFAAQIKELKKQ